MVQPAVLALRTLQRCLPPQRDERRALEARRHRLERRAGERCERRDARRAQTLPLIAPNTGDQRHVVDGAPRGVAALRPHALLARSDALGEGVGIDRGRERLEAALRGAHVRQEARGIVRGSPAVSEDRVDLLRDASLDALEQRGVDAQLDEQCGFS